MRILIAFFLAAAPGFGFACGSAGTGFWTDPAKWTTCNGSFPGIGDTAQLNSSHTLTIPLGVQIIVGTSGASGTVAVTCDTGGGSGCSTAVLIINGTFTFRGSVVQNGAWQANAGAIIEHDSSAASSPSTTNYTWTIGRQLTPTTGLTIAGTAGNRVTIRNATSSGRFGGFQTYSTLPQNSGIYDFAYVNISGCGVGSSAICTDASASAGSFHVRCDHCNVTDSGYMFIGCFNASFTNSTFTSPVRSDEQAVHWTASCGANGDIVLTNIYLEGQLWMSGSTAALASATISNVIIRVGGTSPIALTGTFQLGLFDRLMVISTTNSSGNPAVIPGAATITRLMGLRTSNSNPHFFSGPNYPNTTIDGGFGEVFGAGNDGDFMLAANAGGTTTLRNIITVPTGLGNHPGTFVNATSNQSSTQWVGEQNTLASQDQGNGTGIGFSGEIASGTAGQFHFMRDNIGYAIASHEAYIERFGPSGTPVDGYYSGANYNWKWNFSNSGYFSANAKYTSPSPPGTNDTTGDPKFTEIRRFLDWGQRLDPTITTWAQIVAKMAAMNDDTGYDPRFNSLDAYNWLRAGFRPRNSAVMTAGHAGGRVGAMDIDSKFGPLANQGQ